MMQHSNKTLMTLTVFAMALLMQPRAECYAQGWPKVGKKLVESFMKQFGKVATEVSVRVLADQLTKQIDKYDGKARENEYVYIQLSWNFYGHQHVGVLTLGENGGFFRVAFFNSQSGLVEAVDQNLSVRETNGNVYLQGDTPRYAGTNITHPAYLPDILLTIPEDGGLLKSETSEDIGFRFTNTVSTEAS
jgi:hypothetical protein